MKAWLTAEEEEAERMAQEETERMRREAVVPEMNGGSSDSDDYNEYAPGMAVMRPGAGSSRGDDPREGMRSVNTQYGTRSPRGSAVPSMAPSLPFGISFNLPNQSKLYSIGFGPPRHTLLN